MRRNVRVVKAEWPQTRVDIRGNVFGFGLDERNRLVVFGRKTRPAHRAKPEDIADHDWQRACALAERSLRSSQDHPPATLRPQQERRKRYRNRPPSRYHIH